MKVSVLKAPPPHVEDEEWKARADAEDLIRAEEIKGDHHRHRAARRHLSMKLKAIARAHGATKR